MTQTVAQVRAALRRDTATLGKLSEKMAEVEARRTERIKLARQLGATGVELSEDTSLSEGRISQIAPAKAAKRAAKAKAAPAGKAAVVKMPLTDKELPAPFRPGAVASVKTSLSEYVSDAYNRKWLERTTVFLDQETGEWYSPGAQRGRIEWREHSAAELLEQIPEAVERVYLVGANRVGVRPETRHLYDSEADAVRSWFLRPVPGWDVDADGHFLADEDNPTGRWVMGAEDRARRVEVCRAAGWFGEGRYSAAEAARAWWVLRNVVATAFGENAILLSTAATTGRDLWRRTIGYNRDNTKKTYPVLSEELRQLIQSTSGQGRREIVPAADAETIPGFVQYDMRFAYAALAWGMPVGEPTMWSKRKLDQEDDDAVKKLLKGRGRWQVTATVPSGWERVGLLPAPAAAGSWCYPAAPGQKFTTWASGGEVELAREMGWRIELREGFTFQEGKPLNTWRDKLTTAYAAAEARELPGPEVAGLVRAALRNLVLMTIGAFAARSHMVSRSMPATPENEGLLPTNRPVREVDGVYLWEEQGELSEWNKRLAHPEWSAEIWARCRLRLLNAPTADRSHHAGMLWVPPHTVIGCRTDAVYLTAEQGWADDGKPGRYRLKGKLDGEMPRPTNDAELDAMKTKAAANV
ncbi:hypothetical protein [Streptomyces sp. NPDC051657]|uniref:hypothetical protein n=1 Tax=unclassified Streptomyces TaxID=2593676 RepID=UPI00341FE1F2